MSWKPVDLNDFEKQMVNLEPNKEYFFSRKQVYEEDYKRRNILDRRQTKEDSELTLLSHLHDTDIIPKIPGKLLDRDDLARSDPTEETVKMMRSIGMQPSINERMVQSRSIATKKKQPKIIYDRNMPIFLGEEFFKFKPRSHEQPEPQKEESTEADVTNDSTYFDCKSTNSSYCSCGSGR
ncbi:hypothetical protein ACFFRR_005145 [Megaselia abdita]